MPTASEASGKHKEFFCEAVEQSLSTEKKFDLVGGGSNAHHLALCITESHEVNELPIT